MVFVLKNFGNKLEAFDVTDLGSGMYLCNLIQNNTPILVLKIFKFGGFKLFY